MKKVESKHGIYLLDNTSEEVKENFQDAVKEVYGEDGDSFPGPLDVLKKTSDTFKSMVDSHCEQCAHYHADDDYDWCHECMMECDHFKAKEEITEVERENDRYNQEQDWMEEHAKELE